MMRALTLLVALLVAGTARAVPPAVPCPFMQAGWSFQYQGPITSVQYDQSRLWLYVVFGGTTVSAFANVPFAVMQAFQNTKDPLGVYNSYVLPFYHAFFLIQTNNCPLELEGSSGDYLWTD